MFPSLGTTIGYSSHEHSRGGHDDMILEKIRQLYPKLTKSQKRLAEYIATSYQEAAFMTASRLAHTVLVNEATVIRFAQRLGYPGYPELAHDLQEMVHSELRARAPTAIADGQEVLLAVLGSELDALQRAVGRITPEFARQVGDLLNHAERVLVVGQGISAPLARLMGASLRELGVRAEDPAADPLSLAVALEGVTAGYMVIGISAAGECWEVANALRYANEQGAHTLALASSPIAPVAQAAELAVCCPASDLPMPSVAVIATMIDALIQTVAVQRTEALQERHEQLSRLCDYLTSSGPTA